MLWSMRTRQISETILLVIRLFSFSPLQLNDKRRFLMSSPSVATTSNAFLAIFWGGLACGVFDITQACVGYGIQNHLPPMRIFQSVAAGVLGRSASQGGVKTAALGLALH